MAGTAHVTAPTVLCAGIAVEDFIFRVDQLPTPGTKSAVDDFLRTSGGCAANAAIAIARLGGHSRFAGPLGDDPASDRIVQALRLAGVTLDGLVRAPGATASFSGIFIDAIGERLLATRRAHGLNAARLDDPEPLIKDIDVLLIDNHFRDFVLPLCRAARARSMRIVVDVDRPTHLDDPLLTLSTHPIFSSEAARGTTGMPDLTDALSALYAAKPGFVAVTDGARGTFWRRPNASGHVPALTVNAVDTLAAGDVFHGAFALALGGGSDEIESMRFASAAAAIKCTKFGGIAGSPNRQEVDALLHRDG